MILSGEMKAYCIRLLVSDVEEMASESLSYCVLGLSNVLFSAGFAGYTVDEVGTFTTDVVFARVFFACGDALEFLLTP